jgi:hypothetical protein
MSAEGIRGYRFPALDGERDPYAPRLVRFPGQTFFSTLRRKLNWGDLEERSRGPAIP